jgi:hypothetical protein
VFFSFINDNLFLSRDRLCNAALQGDVRRWNRSRMYEAPCDRGFHGKSRNWAAAFHRGWGKTAREHPR